MNDIGCKTCVSLSVQCTVVTVSLYSKSVSVDRCFHEKSVVGSGSVFIHVHQAPLYGFYDVQFGTVGLPSWRSSGVRAWCILPRRRGG